jgi:hypothetical protein
VYQRPGSALASGDSFRRLSAHSLVVNFGGGFNAVAAVLIKAAACVLCPDGNVIGKLIQHLKNLFFD